MNQKYFGVRVAVHGMFIDAALCVSGGRIPGSAGFWPVRDLFDAKAKAAEKSGFLTRAWLEGQRIREDGKAIGPIFAPSR
jgi:hypothetical protein